jgi:hypothetical protein
VQDKFDEGHVLVRWGRGSCVHICDCEGIKSFDEEIEVIGGLVEAFGGSE